MPGNPIVAATQIVSGTGAGEHPWNVRLITISHSQSPSERRADVHLYIDSPR